MKQKKLSFFFFFTADGAYSALMLLLLLQVCTILMIGTPPPAPAAVQAFQMIAPLRNRVSTRTANTDSVVAVVRPALIMTQLAATTKNNKTTRNPQPENDSNNRKHQAVVGVDNDIVSPSSFHAISDIANRMQESVQSFWTVCVTVMGILLLLSTSIPVQPASAAASANPDIVGCLFQKCPAQLTKCVLNPKCLANVICINTCTGRPDEINCQIQCGDIFENPVVGEFNKCVISDTQCVPQQPDTGQYPIPTGVTVSSFNTNFFNGRLYITAGQNPLFDIFPCQVHFFTETEPGKFFGKLNWRVTEPDGEFFTRDALQEFKQDPNDPSHMINHDNEYLHYKDDWWIIDYEYDNNDKNIPPFAFVYYRGSNDAWDGYGGAVVYTRDAQLPQSLLPRLREAAKKVNFDFDKDFVITDNSCPAELSEGEKLLLREQFAGNVALQTEQQIQAQATRLRGNVVNSVKAQKLFFENRFDSASKAFQQLEKNLVDFEKETIGAVITGSSSKE